MSVIHCPPSEFLVDTTIRSGAFSCHCRDEGDFAASARLVGELDLASVESLESGLGVLERSGADQIHIDLGGLEFVDCAGLEALDASRRRCEEAGATIVFTAAAGQPAMLIELTGALVAETGGPDR